MARKGTPTKVNSPRRIKKGEPGYGTKKRPFAMAMPT